MHSRKAIVIPARICGSGNDVRIPFTEGAALGQFRPLVKAAGTQVDYCVIVRLKLAVCVVAESVEPVLETIVFATTVTTCAPIGVR